jgi:crotonobetainyl-CoA:carnitine CoA-transferase CaiB-like acyl-CoA transferase
VQLSFGRLASNRPRSDPFDPLANFYKSRDERWFVLNPRGGASDWPALARACGKPDLPQDERFRTGRLRKDNNRALVAEFDEAFGAMDFDEIARRLDEADLVWAPVQTPAEVAADPQAAAAGAFVEVEDGRGGAYRSPAAPARFPGADSTRRPRAPELGEHTAQVLAELGYSEGEIAAMRAEGAAV